MSDGDRGLRVRLVRAGVELLANQGGDAVSLREIARRAGVSHGAPRRYFPTHRDLLAAIAREGYRALADEISAAVTADHPDPYARLLALGRTYLRFAEAQPEMFALMFRHDLLRGNEEGLRQVSRLLFDDVVRLVGQARPDLADPELVAAALWANLHGIAQLRQWGSLQVITQTDDREAVLRTALDAYLEPAGAPPAG